MTRPAAAGQSPGDPMPDLLIELFSEEIPARMQTRAADDLRDGAEKIEKAVKG